MPLASIDAAAALARLDEFDAVIDARSESEFAEDHLPGAVNWPSLTDAERAEVGTEYKQVSAFDARKRGAALVAANIARHLDREMPASPRTGRRSSTAGAAASAAARSRSCSTRSAFAPGCSPAATATTGAPSSRRSNSFPRRFAFRVVCGPTGSGKSRLLQALAAEGAQVLDLEALANHRGSVLGLVPGSRQPSQKAFDTAVWDALRRLDPTRPVFIESESKKIGDLRVPEALIARMRASPCVWLELALDQRVDCCWRSTDSS